jgi:hypothetical protein
MFELTTKYANGQQQALELHRLRIEHEKLYANRTVFSSCSSSRFFGLLPNKRFIKKR